MHGSALFERGETQILGVTTLNMLKMEQQIDSFNPEKKKRYVHHYNFPPFSTGETGRVGSPKRREIGHGALAERALVPVLPSREDFPYAIRQVSEALGSNGSTSMGSVCASTLALLNAGVPLKAPVAGIAMGLVSDTVDGETRYAALTDILGAEDAFGDMDFKVAGTSEFVTAIQLDTKLDGIPASVLAGALAQAHDARIHILGVMAQAINEPDEMSEFAPRVITVRVPDRQDRRGHWPEGQDDQPDPGRHRRGHLDRGRRHRVHRRHRRPVGGGRSCRHQRDRQPAHARDRRALRRHGRQDGRLWRVRLAQPRAVTACCTSRRSASSWAAPAWRTSKTCSPLARRSRWRSPRSTRAASCRSAWSRRRAPRLLPRSISRRRGVGLDLKCARAVLGNQGRPRCVPALVGVKRLQLTLE